MDSECIIVQMEVKRDPFLLSIQSDQCRIQSERYYKKRRKGGSWPRDGSIDTATISTGLPAIPSSTTIQSKGRGRIWPTWHQNILMAYINKIKMLLKNILLGISFSFAEIKRQV